MSINVLLMNNRTSTGLLFIWSIDDFNNFIGDWDCVPVDFLGSTSVNAMKNAIIIKNKSPKINIVNCTGSKSFAMTAAIGGNMIIGINRADIIFPHHFDISPCFFACFNESNIKASSLPDEKVMFKPISENNRMK